MPSAADAALALRLLARRGLPQPASAIARDLGLPRSSTYRLLQVLRDAGLVSHDPQTRRWGLGVGVYDLGAAYTRQAPLTRLAAPVLASLVDETGANGHLAILHGADALYLIEERAPGRAPLVSQVGVRLPATLTASGLAILAALPKPQVRALFPDADAFVRRHDAGVTSPRELAAELAEVRRRGHSLEVGLVTPGRASVGAAVHDHTGTPVAAVASTVDETELDPDRQAQLADAVRGSAEQISRRLGFRGI